ncbi:MAG: GNAT family N-acetyltransferase [Hyphomicrobiaceae bacterium]
MDRIFFEASNTKTFASDDARRDFRTRWLGRYLDHRPDLFHVALTTPPDQRLAGYLAGALDDPARTDLYRDIGYFPLLGAETSRFPAHLHINLANEFRGRGIGSRLIERFVDDVAAAGLPGVHVVTGASSRNVGFYRRNGFVFEKRFDWHGSLLVLLGRSIGDGAAPAA